MEETTTTTQQPVTQPKAQRAAFGAPDAHPPRKPREGGAPRRAFADRPKDIDQKILDIRRVTRVVAGGRRMSFAVSMIIGDKKGVVGVGVGKGNDTALAINKAVKDAKKHAIKIKRNEKLSIDFDVSAKYCSSRVMIFPNKGKGLVAGAAIRDILIMAGVRDVSSKVLSGSKNKLNTARATMKALSAVATPYTFGGEKIVVAPIDVEAIAPVIEEVK